MINIKFKNLFLFIFFIIFFFVIFYFEFYQNKQNNVSKLEKVKILSVYKVKILSVYNDNVFNSYANILISENIIYNKEILNFSKVEILEPRPGEIKQIIIIFDYSTDGDKNSKLNKIKNEIIFINNKLKEEIFRYLDNKTEYLLLPEQSKIFINHYNNKKNYEFINLIVINEQKIELAIKKEEKIIRFIHYLIISFFLSFIFSFFFNYFLKNKKDLLNFFDKL
jgi:hypothetical protein